MRTSRVASALLAVLVLAGCRERTAIWVEPGSTAEHLTFVVGPEEGEEARLAALLRVYECGNPGRRFYTGDAYWIASIDTSRVLYGASTWTVRPQIPARPLTPGCYHASTDGGAEVAFVVDEAGEVVQLPEVPR
jgi:hypothetical protein